MKKLALAIGINAYPSPNQLSGCVNDCRDWEAALAAKGFEVTSLTDKQATGDAIREHAQDLIDKAEKGDSLVMTYSGHGSYVHDEDGDETDGLDEIICPVDIHEDYISDDELFGFGVRARSKGAKLVLLSDSCHSGTVMRFSVGKLPPPIENEPGVAPPVAKVRFLPPQNFVAKKDIPKIERASRFGVKRPPWKYAGLLISGSADTEFSYDAWFQNRPNGAFTYVALRALEKLGAKGGSYSLWHKNIRKALPSSQYPQSPNLFGASNMKSRWKVFA